jgi:predicted glycosyltransferase involved in capsule biosynthesis
MYEEYFSSYNKVINAENARASGVDYADIEQPIAEVLEYFLRTDYLSKISANKFSMPTLTTTGYDTYMLLDIKCRPVTLKIGVNTSIVSNQLIDSAGGFLSLDISAGDVVTNLTTGLTSTVVSVLSNTVLLLDSNIFLTSGNAYAIISSATIVQVEKVINNKIALLVNSNLTQPNKNYPIYALQGSELTFYPITINNKGQVQATYFRYPKVPKWTYITLVNGEPAFDQSQPDYQDFELPQEDGYKLAMKILQYCGISIRESEVAAYAIGQEQHEQPTFSQQQ